MEEGLNRRHINKYISPPTRGTLESGPRSLPPSLGHHPRHLQFSRCTGQMLALVNPNTMIASGLFRG
jgi:hypothetical protein